MDHVEFWWFVKLKEQIWLWASKVIQSATGGGGGDGWEYCCPTIATAFGIYKSAAALKSSKNLGIATL